MPNLQTNLCPINDESGAIDLLLDCQWGDEGVGPQQSLHDDGPDTVPVADWDVDHEGCNQGPAESQSSIVEDNTGSRVSMKRKADVLDTEKGD